jgi:hypothetical protein
MKAAGFLCSRVPATGPYPDTHEFRAPAQILLIQYTVTYSRLATGFRLVIGFTGHLKLVTAAVANSHTLQFTTTRTKSCQFAVSSPVVAE